MTIPSKLRPFLATINQWIEQDSDLFINDCIVQAEELVRESKIKPRDKVKMLGLLDEWRWTEDPGLIPNGENHKRKEELVKYLYNALLKYEGLGVAK